MRQYRKVIFEDPFCLNDNCPTTDQPATDIRVGHQNIENEIFNKTVEGTENINYDKESFDLKEQDHMNDIKRRLSLIQNNYANKVLPPTSSKAERDIDEHLEKINQQNISHRQFHALPQTQTSGHRSNTMKSVMNQKLLPGQRSKKSNIKSKLSDRQLESSQRNNSFLKQKQVISSNSKLKTTDSISKPKNQLELTNMRPKSSTNIIGDNIDDPEITLNKLQSYLGNSDIVLNPKVQEFEDKRCDEEPMLNETKEMVNELRTIYHEVKELLLNVRNQVTERPDMKSVPTENGVNMDPGSLLSNSQPVLSPGSLLPSIRLAMEYSGKSMTPSNEISQIISNLPDDPLVKATTALIEVNRRRNNLENNLATLESSNTDQSIFGLLDLMSKDKSSADKARIQAMINDAIDKVAQEKKHEYLISTGRMSRPSTKIITQTKSRSRATVDETSRPYSSPSKSRNVIELFDQPKICSTDRSPSPVTLTSPWRLNRRRAKRPLYPRSVNDPVRPRTAVLRLSDENLAGISSPRGRISRSNTKVVRFMDDQFNGPAESIESQKVFNPRSDQLIEMQMTGSNKPVLGIIPLGMYQYSLSIPSKQVYEQVNKNLYGVQTKVDSQGVVFEQLNQSNNTLDVQNNISDQLNKNQPQTQDTSSKEDLQQLVEAALLERLGSILPPSPDNRNVSAQYQRVDTPLSSPERSSRIDAPSIRTPTDSPHRSELPYPVGHVGVETKGLDPAPKWQPYNPDEESIFKNAGSPTTDRRNISTPDPSFVDNSSLRSRMRSHSSSPVKQKSVILSPIPLSSRNRISERNISEKSVDIVSGSRTSNSSVVDGMKSSSTSEPFSLTAPDTFSDGVWLLDRSEGEAPYPTSYNKVKLTMSKMEPIQSSTRRNNSLTLTFSISRSTSSINSSTSSSSSSKYSKTHSQEEQISPGEFPNALTANRLHRNQINPLNNPMLHVLALKNSKQFNRNQLSQNERKELKKLKTQLEQNRKPVNGIVHSSSLEWLANLSGSPLPSLNVNHQSKVNLTKSKPKVDIKVNDESSTSIGEVRQIVSSQEPIKQSATIETNHSISEAETKMSMLRQVELVHSDDDNDDDSDATTINEEAYDEDDLVGEHSKNHLKQSDLNESGEIPLSSLPSGYKHYSTYNSSSSDINLARNIVSKVLCDTIDLGEHSGGDSSPNGKV
ncbi:unnamed protein product [Heterobilharzia americana]|nr:unnamed protein product [Heterobilharzia americana]